MFNCNQILTRLSTFALTANVESRVNGISIEEIPCEKSQIGSYFSSVLPPPFRSHTRTAGAGKWFNVDKDNYVGDPGCHDIAGIGMALSPLYYEETPDGGLVPYWKHEEMIWEIPFGWTTPPPIHARPIGAFATDTRQSVMIDDMGTSGVRKFWHVVKRKRDGTLFKGIIRLFKPDGFF